MHGGRGRRASLAGVRGPAQDSGTRRRPPDALPLLFMSALLESNSVSNMEITHTRGEHPF